MTADLFDIEATGSTLDDAVDHALSRFACSRAEVDLEIIQFPSRGFLGLFGKKNARVRVRLTDRAFIAKMISHRMLELSGTTARVEVVLHSQQIELQIFSDDSSLIIGRHGQTLDALQSLVISMTDRLTKDRTPIVLDSDNYRQRRIESLSNLARRISRKVRRSGVPATLHPLPPEERRILHEVLQEESGIESRSVGGGYERKMIISRRRN